jgi:hypothetical protein
MKSRKLKSKVRVKKTEADLAVFKLIINNQGKFIIEKSMYHLNKIELHFKKENSGLINSMLRECYMEFERLSDFLDQIVKKIG